MSTLVGVLGAVALALAVWVVLVHNRLVRLRTLVDEAWGDVDVELSRRHDLIPNLVETVHAYADHEREVLETLTRARAEATAHRDERPASREGFEETVAQALRTVLARVEAYPDLTASPHFLSLQRELTLTEDRIAAARRFHNGNVRAYNTRVQTFPSLLVARLFSFRTRDFFELRDSVTASGPAAGPA